MRIFRNITLAVIPAAALGLALAGCGGGSSGSPSANTGTTTTVAQSAGLYPGTGQDDTSAGVLSPGTQVSQHCAWSITKTSNITTTLVFEDVTVTSGPLAGRDGSVVAQALSSPWGAAPACGA